MTFERSKAAREPPPSGNAPGGSTKGSSIANLVGFNHLGSVPAQGLLAMKSMEYQLFLYTEGKT